MKTIKRFYFNELNVMKEGKFVNNGQWANGMMSYSRLDDNNQIIEEEDGVYYQIRYNGRLVMCHI